MTIEYRVVPVTRWLVMRCENEHEEKQGEYSLRDVAYEAGEIMAFNERENLGWPPGDERMMFPDASRRNHS